MNQDPCSSSQGFAGAALALALGAVFYVAATVTVVPAWAGVSLVSIEPERDHGPTRAQFGAIAYPDEENAEGVITVRLQVDETGRVDPGASEVQSNTTGSNALADATLAAARDWTFHPAVADGRAVASMVVLPVTFRHHGGLVTAESMQRGN